MNKELLTFCTQDVYENYPTFTDSTEHEELKEIIETVVAPSNIYYNYRNEFKWDWTNFYSYFVNNTNRLFQAYKPVLTPEKAVEGMVEVEVLNKKLEQTGKRTFVKLGRFLSKIPYLTDKDKEVIVTRIKDSFQSEEGLEFNIQDYDIEKVVQMPGAKSSGNIVTGGKLLKNSCMRDSAKELGLDVHPYAAYNSGDFWIAYLQKDGKLFARTIVHKGSGTYAPIYVSNKFPLDTIKTHLRNKGFIPMDYEGEGDEWLGAKLLSIESDYYYDDEYEDSGIVAPYLDVWEYEYGYSDGEFIHQLDEPPRDSKRYQTVNMKNSEGIST